LSDPEDIFSLFLQLNHDFLFIFIRVQEAFSRYLNELEALLKQNPLFQTAQDLRFFLETIEKFITRQIYNQ